MSKAQIRKILGISPVVGIAPTYLRALVLTTQYSPCNGDSSLTHSMSTLSTTNIPPVMGIALCVFLIFKVIFENIPPVMGIALGVGI